MREYMKRQLMPPAQPEKVTLTPGYTLSQIIDQFYAEGVVPDFIPADLGEDAPDELTEDGYFAVDPLGNIRTDPFEAREEALMAGVKDPDPAPSLAPPVSAASAVAGVVSSMEPTE